MITGKQISLFYKKKPILKKISFEVPKGRTVAFIGKSGTGKTSLLKCMAHLIPDFEGKITIKGRCGLVFQEYHLFPHMTVKKNCIHPQVKVLKKSRSEAETQASFMLDLFGMKEFENHYPMELSGGQKQRVALARAMCLEPEVILFDEPTAALDHENRKNFVEILKNLKNQGITIVLSTHDPALLQATLDQVYLIEEGEVVEKYDRTQDSLESKPKLASFLKIAL